MTAQPGTSALSLLPARCRPCPPCGYPARPRAGIALLRHGGQQGKRGLEAAGDRLRLTAPDGGLRLPRMQELVVTDRNGDHAAAPFRRRLAVHSPPDGVSA